MRRLVAAASIALFWLLAGISTCAPVSAQEIPLRLPPGSSPPDARAIADYPEAVGAIVWVMVNRFGLPAPRGTLEVHATREGFERAMIRHLKISPELARSTAQFAKSAVGSFTVLVNAPAVADSTWPQRIELIAHELTHSLQLTLANRPGLARPQWLIEGFAEWMAFQVTDALGLDDLNAARERITGKVRDLRRKGELPRLLRVGTFAEWVEARRQYGFDGTYSLSFLVTDFLVRRHSLSAMADYFRRFERSDDHAAHFRAAFGEEPGEFERALERHLAALLE